MNANMWLRRVKKVGSFGGTKLYPRANKNVRSTVNEHAKTAGHDVLPNYASILETGAKTRTKGFIELLHSFLDRSPESTLPKGLCITLFLPKGQRKLMS